MSKDDRLLMYVLAIENRNKRARQAYFVAAIGLVFSLGLTIYALFYG